MNKKITTQFIIRTFYMTIAVAGIMYALAQFGITLKSHAWTQLLFIIYILMPAATSYITLKKNGKVKDLKEWFNTMFHFKSKIFHYSIVILGVALFFVLRIAVSGLTEMQPFYIFFLLIPVMVVGGGVEETGWRYILQSEFNKKFGFLLSSTFTGLIWYAWHLPLFMIPGTAQYETFDVWMYAPFLIGLAFLLGAIFTISNNVFLCVLCHAMINAGLETMISPFTWEGTIVTALALILISLVIFAASGKQIFRKLSN